MQEEFPISTFRTMLIVESKKRADVECGKTHAAMHKMPKKGDGGYNLGR